VVDHCIINWDMKERVAPRLHTFRVRFAFVKIICPTLILPIHIDTMFPDTYVTFDMRDSTSYADPGLKMWDTFACVTAIFLTHFIISITVLENVPPDTGLQNRATYSTLNIGLDMTGNRTRAMTETLNVGLDMTGNRTRAPCVASSVARRSAILYAFP
jgi:hypothetical protein